MSRSTRAGAILLGACLLGCPLLVGCIPIGYVYPTVAHVPSVEGELPAGEVHAFRVDVAEEQNGIEFADNDRYVLSAIPLSQTGEVPAQTKLSCDYGWMLISPLTLAKHTHHTVLVRLYRPGWQTVEVKAGESADQVSWNKAADSAAQEKAVDDLVSTWATDRTPRVFCATGEQLPRDALVFRNLATGSASARHKQVLLFAAAEYDRLAATAAVSDPADQQTLTRLTGKAKNLRDLAGK